MKKVWILALFVIAVPQCAFAGLVGDLIEKVKKLPRPFCSRRAAHRDVQMGRRSRLVKDALTVGAGIALATSVVYMSSTYAGASEETSNKLSVAISAGITPLLSAWTKSFEIRFGHQALLEKMDEMEELATRLWPLIEAYQNRTLTPEVENLKGLGEFLLLCAELQFLQGEVDNGNLLLQRYQEQVFNNCIARGWTLDLLPFHKIAQKYSRDALALHEQMRAAQEQDPRAGAERGSDGEEFAGYDTDGEASGPEEEEGGEEE